MRRVVLATLIGLAACGGGGGSNPPPPTPPPMVNGPAWPGFARDAQHSGLGATAAQGGVAAMALNRIVWTTVVDQAPPANPATTPIHYGSPLISAHNTVLVPVKTSAAGAFQVQARSGFDGSLLWSAASDYLLPPTSGWIAPYGPALTPTNRLYLPAAGGRILYRDLVDSAGGTTQPLVFYGASSYLGAPATFDASVYINTPLTVDGAGNLYFGFLVTASNPANLVSGYARIGTDGAGSWVAANAALATSAPINSATNAAPALSPDGSTLYVVAATVLATTATHPAGYLLALDATTLATKSSVALMDPFAGTPAWVSDSSTASPLVGPDGDVYFGVLEANFPAHNDRGWLLHFDASLAIVKTPGSFGWDNTPSVVPATVVSAYTGSSSYLLLSKYNNYADFPAGDGRNRMAILDPARTQADPVLGNAVMQEVITVLGPTSDAANFPTKPAAVKEWCVNTAAVDPIGRAVLVNSEDGYLYRWDMVSGALTQKIALDSGYAQAYTPTALGPDGTVYAINAGILHAVRN